MIETELQPGDIIFFINNYHTLDNPDDTESGYVDHVAMFAGYHEKQPLIIHSITSQSGHYQPYKPSGLCTTTLRALKNQIQQEDGYEDRHYDVSFQVFRNKKDPALAEAALAILQKQATYRIPYDDKRLQNKIALKSPKKTKA